MQKLRHPMRLAARSVSAFSDNGLKFSGLLSLRAVLDKYARAFFGIGDAFASMYALLNMIGDPPTRPFERDRLNEGIAIHVNTLLSLCDEVGLPFTKQAIERFFNSPPTEISKMALAIEEINARAKDELDTTWFLHISGEKLAHYEQDDLFGIKDALPSANREVKQAGTCYATGNSTACVFHLMRAVEVGTRVLVRALGKRKIGGKNVPVELHDKPIELADWDTISVGIKKKIGLLPNSKSVRITREKEFYTTANAQFHNFKDAWRNHVSHARESYDEYQAMSVMVNVKHYLIHLATRLKE